MEGLEIFKEAFEAYSDNYVIIESIFVSNSEWIGF